MRRQNKWITRKFGLNYLEENRNITRKFGLNYLKENRNNKEVWTQLPRREPK